MKNESKIKGNKNYVLQNNHKSKININTKIKKIGKKEKYGLISILIGLIGLIATIIIGWENIIKFFTK